MNTISSHFSSQIGTFVRSLSLQQQVISAVLVTMVILQGSKRAPSVSCSTRPLVSESGSWRQDLLHTRFLEKHKCSTQQCSKHLEYMTHNIENVAFATLWDPQVNSLECWGRSKRCLGSLGIISLITEHKYILYFCFIIISSILSYCCWHKLCNFHTRSNPCCLAKSEKCLVKAKQQQLVQTLKRLRAETLTALVKAASQAERLRRHSCWDRVW